MADAGWPNQESSAGPKVRADADAASPVRPAFDGLSDPVLSVFSSPAHLSADAISSCTKGPGVHVVWDPRGELLYVGSSRSTRDRLQQHLSGDRQASILHKKVGEMLDAASGVETTRDAIRAWLESCWFAVAETNEPDELKAAVMDRLSPPLNQRRPSLPEGAWSSVSRQGSVSELLVGVMKALSGRDRDSRDLTPYKHIVEFELPRSLQPLLPSGYAARGRTGVGDPAEVPWVGIFPDGNASAKRGLYVVYLFAADGSRVFLSLAQGIERVRGGTPVLRKRAMDIRGVLPGRPMYLTDIDLASEVQRPRMYAAANVYALRYDRNTMPDAGHLQDDLKEFVAMMEEVRPYVTEIPEREPVHLLMKWSAELKPSTVVEHRAVADSKGAVWWGKVGRPNTTPISSARLAAIHDELVDGMLVRCYIYRKGELWRTRLLDVTLDAAQVDRERLPDYQGLEECNMFALLTDFEELPASYALERLLLATNPSPEAMAGALGNQTSPLLVFERGLPAVEEVGIEMETNEGSSEPAASLDLNWLAERTLWSTSELQEVLDALAVRPQIILAGPPGTGKTWVAKHLARYLTQDDPLAYRILQFHPSYGYEEFIEGLRPEPGGQGLAFKRVDGAVLRMVNQITDTTDRKHVLILDEMNRANLPRVFGELMYLLEYRDEPADLLYSQDFELPSSLLLIGSMNTADRSIRSLDIALRRRFEVFECQPSVEILRRYYSSRTCQVEDLIEGFVKLNHRLTELLDRHHTIGHTFFMAESMTSARLRSTWQRQLQPLLEEYFFDQPAVAATLHLEEFWPSAG